MQTQNNQKSDKIVFQSNDYKESDVCSCCYFYSEDKNHKFVLPIVSNTYNIQIVNKFAQIKSVQKYKNPFDKNLQIHYAIPFDPSFVISKLIVKYQGVVLEGLVKEREQVKAQYKEAKQKGETVMMAAQDKKQSSILTVRIGNIEPQQIVQVQFTLMGQLKCELENELTLRIPSHIGPRYHTQKDALQKLFEYFSQFQPNTRQMYLDAVTQWDFNIKLICSQAISFYTSSSHKLKSKIISPKQYLFSMNQEKVPEIDLQFTYSHCKPQITFCTLGQKCAAVTFCTVPSQKINSDTYKGEYIFLLDRSGSMGGDRIKKATQSLILFLLSLPRNSYFNVISFGSQYKKMYEKSQKYTKSLTNQAIKQISKFGADFGGTQILQPLQEIHNTQKEQIEPGYQRHVIVLTDGQVSNTDQVIEIIKKMKEKQIATTHMIGIGNGVSYDMIENGAKQGGGQSLFIINSQELKKQVIFLLENITLSKITNLNITVSDTELIDMQSVVIPRNIRKGRQITIYVNFKKQIISLEQLKGQYIQLQYEDEDENFATIHHRIQIQPNVYSSNLHKLKSHLQIQKIISTGEGPKCRQLAIEKSIKDQVLCKFTAFICKIKQNQSETNQVNNSYLLKIKNSLEGHSTIRYRSFGCVSLKTLTGRSVDLQVPLNITIIDYKCLIEEIEGIPVDQQRMIFAARQLEDSYTLQEYGIDDGSVIHLVLRLRGGDGGSSRSLSTLWNLKILSEGIQVFMISLNDKDVSIATIYQRIYQKYPELVDLEFTLVNNQILLQKNKNISEYGICKTNNEVNVNLDNFYFDILKNILSLMQIQGFWKYDQKVLEKLNLTNKYKTYLEEYKQSTDLAMTKVMLQFLIEKFPKQKEQNGLIIKKVNKYLKINNK